MSSSMNSANSYWGMDTETVLNRLDNETSQEDASSFITLKISK